MSTVKDDLVKVEDIDNINERLKFDDNKCWNNLRWVIFTSRGAGMVQWLKDASSMESRGVILVT